MYTVMEVTYQINGNN